MDDRVIHFRVGLMVVASLLIALILALLFGEMPVLRKTYQIRICFPQAPGVTADTPVRKSGILIGRVVRHEFAEDGSVIVTARINEGVPLKQNEVCRIRGSLLGDAVLEYVPWGDPRKPDLPINRDELQQGIVAADPLEVMADVRVQFARAIDSIVSTSDKFGQTIQRVDGIVQQNEEHIHRIIADAQESLSLSKTTFSHLNKMIGDEQAREQIAKAIQQVPELLAETRQMVGRLHETIGSMDRNLRHLEGFAQPLGQRGPELVSKMDQTLSKLDDTLAEIHLFAQALNNNTGTLGQLVHNRELYDRLNETMANLEEVSQRLRPIVEDARVISDKVARHPGILVRDAVRPQANFKGVPGMNPEDLYPYQSRTPSLGSSGLFAPLFQPR